jgi:hypothetical protein
MCIIGLSYESCRRAKIGYEEPIQRRTEKGLVQAIEYKDNEDKKLEPDLIRLCSTRGRIDERLDDSSSI